MVPDWAGRRGSSVRVAFAAAGRNLFKQPKMKAKRFTMFKATVSIGTRDRGDSTCYGRWFRWRLIKDNPYRDKKRNPVEKARVEQLVESHRYNRLLA